MRLLYHEQIIIYEIRAEDLSGEIFRLRDVIIWIHSTLTVWRLILGKEMRICRHAAKYFHFNHILHEHQFRQVECKKITVIFHPLTSLNNTGGSNSPGLYLSYKCTKKAQIVYVIKWMDFLCNNFTFYSILMIIKNLIHSNCLLWG